LALDRTHDLRRDLPVDEDALPDFERDEQPEPLAVVGGAAAVLVVETPDGVGVEDCAGTRAAAQHELVDHA